MPALSLAGLPLTTGFLAKGELKNVLGLAGVGDWVMLLAAVLIALGRHVPSRFRLALPEGDLVVLFECLVSWLDRTGRSLYALRPSADRWRLDSRRALSLIARMEGSEASLPLVGLALLALAVLLWLLTGLGA